MTLFRREPLHRRLARKAGLEEQPVDTGPRWGEVGIHGVARPREWDAVTSVEAELSGDAARFVVLPDGAVVVEDGPEDVSALAQRVTVEPPYRAEAVRRDASTWAVAARRIRVLELPQTEGDAIRVSRSAEEGRRVEVDGVSVFGSLPRLESLLDGDGLVSARRLAGDLFEIEVHRL